MDQNPDFDWFREEIEAMSYIPLDFDLDLFMEVLDSDPSLSPNDTPAEEEFGPQMPQTEYFMPPEAAPFSLQHPVMPAHGLHDAKNNPLLPPPYYAPAEEEFGPQQPQRGYYMPPGAAPFSLQPRVMPAHGLHAAKTNPPPPYYATAEEEFGPQKPKRGYDRPPGAAPFSLQQRVMPAHGLHAAKTNPPPPYYATAEEEFGPQQPQRGYYRPPGAAPFSLQQPVMPAYGFHAAQINPPLPPYYARAEEEFGPQQPETKYFMTLGAAPFSLEQPVMPAPVWPPPMYQPPTDLQPNYMYSQAAPFSYRQVNNVRVTPPQGRGTNLVPFRFINGKLVYGVPAYTAPLVAFDVPEVNAHAPQKRKFGRKQRDKSRLYVTKPPNAFMIFCKEQRPKVVAELQNQECAAVNRVIGQRWTSLPGEEQAKYYKDADRERQLHSQLFPEWSAGDNYGIKTKRIRRKSPAMTEDSFI